MKPKAIIFHGTAGHPSRCWYPWLAERLRSRGYTVELPHYPELNVEPIETFLPKVLDNHVFDEATVLVGHSGGAALLLALLEHIVGRVAQAILVAGYSTPPNAAAHPVLQSAYDWETIKGHVTEIFFINSIRDPVGCDAEQGRRLLERLGGTQIVRDEGHFCFGDDPYPTFELLDRLIA